MTLALWSLLAFAGWTWLLVVLIGAVRAWQVLSGQTPSNGFASGTPHGSDRYWRLNRAHANAAENLPMFGALVLIGAVIGTGDGSFGWLAVAVVIGRLGQTVSHVSAGTALAVNVRFGFFVLQLACMAVMGGLLFFS